MGNERGQSISTFLAVVIFASLVTAGLVVDGGAQMEAARAAELAASAAARAATDETATRRLAGRDLDVGAAVAAARQSLSESPRVSGTVAVAGDGTVRVTTRATVETVFLSLIGIDSLGANGSAEAQLVRG